MADHQESVGKELATLQRRLERERRIRHQAESIAEEALRDAYQKHQALLHATAERERLERDHLDALKTEQLRVVQVTMRTVQDIVNNCLNQLLLLRHDADGHVSLESLTMFDEAIKEISTKLRSLGDLKAFAEKQMAIGYFLDMDDGSSHL